MNLFDEIFKKKQWDSSRSSTSSSQSLQIREIPITPHRNQTKKTASTERALYKGASSSTPKTKLRPETVVEPDLVVRRRNPQIFSQNLTSNVNVTIRKAARPISYQHVPNKALPNEKTTTSSTYRLKEAKSIPSLLGDTNIELRTGPTKIRGKTGKEHHQHHHSTHHTQPQTTHESTASGVVNSSSTTSSSVAPTPLPRTSSASANLNVLGGAAGTTSKSTPNAPVQTGQAPAGKSARGKGGGSRERLIDGTTSSGGDGTRKVLHQQGLASRVDRPVSGESLIELEQIQRQLHEMAAEKSSLMLQLEERLDQVSELQNEIKVLKIYQEQSVHQLEQKGEENAYLRSKLRDVVHSPLSDSEKQQLLLIDNHRHHSSAPASIAVNVANETGDVTACPTPEWDKHSSSNLSDVSVACLQDKINQMQETHYSTNEELQATLQELTDLQRQLTELQLHNNRLGDEKNLMFDSLCRQTDRLKDTRSELDNLKQSLNTTQDNSDADTAQQYAEREAQLLEIVQRLEVERDNLRDRQQEILQDLQQLRISNDQGEEERSRLIERVRMLEGSIDAKVAENRQTEQELSQARDEFSGSKIEIDRLKDILESARSKIVELEQDRDLSDKSELDELLDAARKEKDTLESEMTHLREQVARSRNEIEKLREQVSILQEECKVTRNNAKCTQSELDYKVETLISDKTNLIEQLQRLQEAVGHFEVQNQCLNEDKRQLNGVLSETQRNLSEADEKLVEAEQELGELKKIREDEKEEWEKFQNDLLTSVRVANEFKTEAMEDLQKHLMENKGYREKIRQLEIQIEKLKGGAPEVSLIRSSIRRSIHVTPRKLEEGIVLSAKETELQNSVFSRFKNDKAKIIEQKSDQTQEIKRPNKANKLKDHKNSKLIVIENKMSTTKIQDGDVIPDMVLSKSLQEVNTTIKELKNNPGKSSRGHERSLSNFESKSVSKIQDVVDLPRKKSVDIEDTTVYTGILPKPLTKPIKIKQAKIRTKTTKSLEKLLTEADEEKFRILGDLLAHIDHSVPVHLLSEEDRSLLKLKAFYDSREMYRHKPIAKRPKHELCISNPLLNSVFANPALKKIAEDPKLPTVEAISPNLELQESFYFARKQSKRYNETIESATMLEDGLPERQNHRQTYSTFKPFLNKSQSVSNLCERTFETGSDEEASLKRFLTEEDLSKNFVIAPSDSKLSLNLWNGTYTFSNQPKHRTDSESSYDSELHVYTINDDINRSSSFIFESPQESLERRRRENDSLESTKSLGHLNLSSKTQGELEKPYKTKKVTSDSNLESSGRFRKFVGGIFGSKENLGVIHEARNSTLYPKPELISVEADVHHSLNTLERRSNSIIYYDIPKDDEFERRKSLDETVTKFYVTLPKEPKELTGTSLTTDLDEISSVGSKFEVQEKNLDFDYEETDSVPVKLSNSSASSKSFIDMKESKTKEIIIEPPQLRQITDSLKRQRALAESLCRSNFTEDEIELVQKVVQTNEDSLSRPQSDINNDDIIVIEWIDYCDQCKDVGTIALSLEEYSREIKSGKSVSELDKITRRSTELNEQQNFIRKQENEQILDTRSKKDQFLNAEDTADFLDQENFELLQNFAKASSKKRASIKLDTLERKYNLIDDLDQLPKVVDIQKRQNISRSSSEIDTTSQRKSKEFQYVEDLLNSWNSKTRKKMRSSIESSGHSLSGPMSLQEPVYQNIDQINLFRTSKSMVGLTNKAPKASPRSNDVVNQIDDSTLSEKVRMADDEDTDSNKSLSPKLARPAETVFKLPTLNDPNPKPSKPDDSKEANNVRETNNIPNRKNSNEIEKPTDYPTLERVAVSHVLNNNLPVFSKLNDCIKDGEPSSTSESKLKKDSLEQRTKFQIGSLIKDSVNSLDNRGSFVSARNRFLNAEEEAKTNSRSGTPRGSFTQSDIRK